LPLIEAFGDNCRTMAADSAQPAPPRRRRWYQFSLRAVMLLTLLVAVACGLLARRVQRKRRELEAVQGLHRSVFAECFYAYELENGAGAEPPGPKWLRDALGENFFSDVGALSFTSLRGAHDDCFAKLELFPNLTTLRMQMCDVSDKDLATIQALKKLRTLDLTGTNVADGVGCLAELHDLESLDLHGTHVGDVGAARLAKLTMLVHLDLGYTKITNEGLRSVSKLVNLRDLDLSNTSIDDEGMAALAELHELKTLDLSETPITSAGLQPLTALSNLHELILTDCAVTDAGIARLAELPKLEKLDLMGTQITTRCLPTLDSMKQLKSLKLPREVELRYWEQPREAMPGCEIDPVPPLKAL
jgi:hypothetical protein